MKRIGLTLGKFAPFHKGHARLIETALEQVDDLIVLVYDAPAVTHTPLPVRRGWIRKQFPRVEVIEAWNGPPEVGLTPEIKQKQETYLREALDGRQITHFFSNEPYGAHVAAALGAEDVRPDPQRTEVPISGATLRADPYPHRAFLEPHVYRDLITNVVFVGAPSTGKTTLVKSLAARFDTVWMNEYGREYWMKHQVARRLTRAQLVEIAQGHVAREEALLQQANRYLFTDTNAITTYMFARDYHGTAARPLRALARKAEKRYDLVFLCADDIPYEDTWERSGRMYRDRFQKQITADLIKRRIPYFHLQGSVDERLAHVLRVLERFEKYRPLPELFGWGA